MTTVGNGMIRTDAAVSAVPGMAVGRSRSQFADPRAPCGAGSRCDQPLGRNVLTRMLDKEIRTILIDEADRALDRGHS
jgi:hypothetical protein